ncbi:MAG: hypothetical protein UY04_C0040G0013 [Parcubacteria group bacterium GW2011_GWA2_47_7]|nr:MAG: hypothetical protein UY04_C0040G0013 [Parcubacteria group bacterium GW2011_GWA2_47_7]
MRKFFTIAVYTSAIFGPFWLLLVIASFGILFIPRWYEMIGAFMLFELLFHGQLASTPVAFLYVPLSAYVLLVMLCYEWLRMHIRERTQ